MQSIMPAFAVALPTTPFLFSPTSLYARLPTLTDHRDPRGVRYPLAALLTITALAKLAEQDSPRAIADWAQLRAPALADLFALDRPTMPHATTWNRLFGAAIDPQQFTYLVADFLLAATTPSPRGARQRRRGMIALCLDGKTLRGTIPAGMTRGVHLLAAYLPAQGIVLIEVLVDGKENEIVTARTVLSRVDVRSGVVTGDAGALWAGLPSVGCRGRCGGKAVIIAGVSRRIRRHCLARSPPSSPRHPCPHCPTISPPRPVLTPRMGAMRSDGCRRAVSWSATRPGPLPNKFSDWSGERCREMGHGRRVSPLGSPVCPAQWRMRSARWAGGHRERFILSTRAPAGQGEVG